VKIVRNKKMKHLKIVELQKQRINNLSVKRLREREKKNEGGTTRSSKKGMTEKTTHPAKKSAAI
jgi:hypothetical protein